MNFFRVLVAASILVLGGVIIGCGSNPGNLPTVTPAPQPSATATRFVFPTSTRTRTATPLAVSGTATPIIAEVTLRWDGALISDVDDIMDIAIHLKRTPGIVGVIGDEIQITIQYNPRLVTPQDIRHLLEDMGFRTLK